jgi:GT2 family glycosyltransferase
VAEGALAERIRRDRPADAPEFGPLVSIVILNRDGRDHLERCLRSLAGTAYQDAEVIVVDNGSTDGSPELVNDVTLPYPVHLIRNAENRTFSDANAQAVAIANGELVCFLNNDIEPITPDWLGSMVATMQRTGAVAVGARLIYPHGRGGPRSGARYRDLSLQHRGVDFDRTKPVPMPRPMGPGSDPMSPAARAVEDRVALTAACLLVDRRAYDAVGGLSPDYDYGLEDVDLCLRLGAAGGRLVYDGMAALWHHESATRMAARADDPDASTARRLRNHATFVDRWGPRIYREVLLDAVRSGSTWSETPLRVGVVVADRAGGAGCGLELDRPLTGLEARGWEVTVLAAADVVDSVDGAFDVLILLDDTVDLRQLGRQPVAVAWIADDPEGWLERVWFDDVDIVLVADQTVAEAVLSGSSKSPIVVSARERPRSGPDAAAVEDAMVRWLTASRFGLCIGVSDPAAGANADYRLARAVQRGLEGHGHPTRVHLRGTWDDSVTAREDVNVQLSDSERGPRRAGQVHLLWRPDGRAEKAVGFDGVVGERPSAAGGVRPLLDVAEPLLAARPQRILQGTIL